MTINYIELNLELGHCAHCGGPLCSWGACDRDCFDPGDDYYDDDESLTPDSPAPLPLPFTPDPDLPF